MNNFIYTANPSRIIFGSGSIANLSAEMDGLCVKRALMLSTPNQKKMAVDLSNTLDDRVVGIFAGAVMHVPAEAVDLAMEEVSQHRADCLIAFGGGSTIGLAKALALRTRLPIIAIPTTYAGSEVTSIYGLTDGGKKRTGRNPIVLPKVVLYDPDLTFDLPVPMSMNSGLNSIAHAAEALYAQDGNPIATLMATSGIAALGKALPMIRENPRDPEARHMALYGAWLCGTVLGQVSMGLHHKLCHTLGGAFNLPHAETHAVMLPHVLAFNRDFAGEAMAHIANALGEEDAALGMHKLAVELGAPRSLRALGMAEAGLDHAADLASSAAYPNPRALDRAPIRALLQRAFDGAPPMAIGY
jgi:maleylacetate reductase